MNRVLNCIVPDPPGEAVAETIELTLEAVGRHEMTQAVAVLEEAVQANPFWLRGYLLLGTIYQYEQKVEQAIATTEKGLATCASGLRLFNAQTWRETVEGINDGAVHNRIRKNTERLQQYERMFRHRLATLEIWCGSFDEAIEQLSAIEDEHWA